MHLDGRSVGRFAHPDVEIFALARFEEQDVVAIIKFGELIELVQFAFGVKFSILTAVRQEGVKIIEEVTVSLGRAKNQQLFWIECSHRLADMSRHESSESILVACFSGRSSFQLM